MALPLPAATPLHPRDNDASHLAPHRIKRCTYRRLISLDRARERLYEVECLFPDRRVPMPLGDLDAACPICNSCTAAHIFRAGRGLSAARGAGVAEAPARRPVSRVLSRG